MTAFYTQLSSHTTIYLWLKNENTLETSRRDITTILTWTENQITKCFIPHKLGKISVVLTDHVFFFWVCSFLPLIRKIKGRPLDSMFPTDKIISCKCYCCCSVTKSWLFATPWTAASQASLSLTMSLLKFMSIESVMLSNHFILCCPLILWPSILPSIRVFSNESALCIGCFSHQEVCCWSNCTMVKFRFRWVISYTLKKNWGSGAGRDEFKTKTKKPLWVVRQLCPWWGRRPEN